MSGKSSLNFFFLIILLCNSAGAAIDPLAWEIGARPLALGSAYVGLADNGYALFTNPAGLSDITNLNLTSMYYQPGSGIFSTSLGAALPGFPGGAMGIAYRNQTTPNLTITDEVVADFADQDLSFLFAGKLRENLSLGINFRLLSTGLSKDLAGFAADNGSGSALDVGLKFTPRPGLGIGFSAQGLGGKIKYKDGSEEEIAGKSTLGLSFKIKPELRFNLDLSKTADEPVSRLHIGAEWWLVDYFALRLGVDQSPDPTSPTTNLSHITTGFGINSQGVTFDYTFRKLGDPAETTLQYFSLGYVGVEEIKPAVPEAVPLKLLHFADVPPGFWAKEQIERLTTLGILNYYPDGTFRPNRPISRAEMAMLLVHAKDYPLPEAKKQVFPDVPLGFWAADYIQSAYERKLTYGYPDGTFKPRRSASRAEGITFLSRFAELPIKEYWEIEEKPFADLPLHHWSIGEVLAAREEKILGYLKNKPFRPDQSLTRAELAEVLFRTRSVKEKIKKHGFED